jgi:hypothetical protein
MPLPTVLTGSILPWAAELPTLPENGRTSINRSISLTAFPSGRPWHLVPPENKRGEAEKPRRVDFAHCFGCLILFFTSALASVSCF